MDTSEDNTVKQLGQSVDPSSSLIDVSATNNDPGTTGGAAKTEDAVKDIDPGKPSTQEPEPDTRNCFKRNNWSGYIFMLWEGVRLFQYETSELPR